MQQPCFSGAILPFLRVSWFPAFDWPGQRNDFAPARLRKIVKMRVDRIWEFLQRLSPLTRSCLLTELERLELCGVDMPGSADIQARLRAELRPDGAADGPPTPSKFFFAPLEPLLVDGAPEHANPGRMARSSLVPI